jgi:hypothetical protein
MAEPDPQAPDEPPPVVSLVQLGQDGFLLAKLNADSPNSTFAIEIEVKYIPTNDPEYREQCAVKGNVPAPRTTMGPIIEAQSAAGCPARGTGCHGRYP